MITGAHAIVYSTNAEADRAFLKDVLRLGHVDVGQGWLIFGLPPAEVAVHPGEQNGEHELYLLCEDVNAFVAHMNANGVACGPVMDRRWGLLTEVTLPGGGKLGVYQPLHARPESASAPAAAASTAKKKAKAPAAKAKKKAKKNAAKPARAAKKKAAKPAGKRRR